MRMTRTTMPVELPRTPGQRQGRHASLWLLGQCEERERLRGTADGECAEMTKKVQMNLIKRRNSAHE